MSTDRNKVDGYARKTIFTTLSVTEQGRDTAKAMRDWLSATTGRRLTTSQALCLADVLVRQSAYRAGKAANELLGKVEQPPAA